MPLTVRYPRAPIVAVAALALMLGAGCDGGSAGPTEISAAARAYLDEVLGVLEAHSLQRRTVDWPALRTAVFDAAGAAQTRQDTYLAIERALHLIGDVHTTFRTVEGVVLFISHTSCQAPILDPPQPPPSIGYVRIRTYPGSAPSVTAYVREIQDRMASLDGDDVVGWIVDVRGNQGADQWPMLAAVGPILGEGVVGFSVDGDGVAHPWEYRDGASWLGGTEMHRVADPYRLRRERPPVALIVDNRTTAAGEAVVVAFRGRADNRSFGQETCGLSTVTRTFTMSDGAVLNLTTAVMADRTGAEYGATLVPDEPGLGPLQAFDRAIEWLSEPRP